MTFQQKAKNVQFELQTCTFCASRVKTRLNLLGGISLERPELCMLCKKLDFFCGSRVKVKLYLRGGISPAKAKNVHYLRVTNLHLFVELEKR